MQLALKIPLIANLLVRFGSGIRPAAATATASTTVVVVQFADIRSLSGGDNDVIRVINDAADVVCLCRCIIVTIELH